MAKEPKIYERLTRTRRQFGGYSSLWLASDHILQVQSTGYSERYQRFYLQDIKGLFITHSDRRLVSGIIASALAVCIALPFGLGTKSFNVGLSIMGGLCAVFLLWNHLLGPGCKVFLATGVQTVQLDALVRRPYTNKILGRLIPLVEAAQAGSLAPPSEPAEPVQPSIPPL